MNKAGLSSGVSNDEATFFCLVKRIPARMHPEKEFQSEAERYFFSVNIGGTTTRRSLQMERCAHLLHFHARFNLHFSFHVKEMFFKWQIQLV